MLLQKPELDLKLSISVTTRKRRSSEADGIHYHFLDDKDEFIRRRDAGEFLEHAEVHGNFYGTPRKGWRSGSSKAAMFFSTSTTRARSKCGKRSPRDVVTIFVLPPSMRELRMRAGAAR